MKGESQSSTPVENTNAKLIPTPSLIGMVCESSTLTPISSFTPTTDKAFATHSVNDGWKSKNRTTHLHVHLKQCPKITHEDIK